MTKQTKKNLLERISSLADQVQAERDLRYAAEKKQDELMRIVDKHCSSAREEQEFLRRLVASSFTKKHVSNDQAGRVAETYVLPSLERWR